jgi:S-adenosylmethionine decarboxylase
MMTKSTHYIADFWNIPNPELLDDQNFCSEAVKKAVALANCNLISLHHKKYQPQGLSVIALLAESHCSIHTWPESAYCGIDFYGCGATLKIEAAIEYLLIIFNPKNSKITKLDRGIPDE